MNVSAARTNLQVRHHEDQIDQNAGCNHAPENLVAQLEHALQPEKIPRRSGVQRGDLIIGVRLQRRVPIAHRDHQNEQRSPHGHPIDFLCGHIGQEVATPVHRHLARGVLSHRFVLGWQRVAVDNHFVIMHAHKDKGDERQGEDVQQIEAQQAVGAEVRAAAHQQIHLAANHGGGLGHGCADSHRPERELVPREQVARKRKEERE